MYIEKRNNQNVLFGYIKITDGLDIPLNKGNADYQDVLKWIAAGGTPTADSGVLEKVKQKKIAEYKAEGLNRIQEKVPEWDSFKVVGLLASIWNMLGTPNVYQNSAKGIFVYVKNTAIPAVKALTTVAAVQAVDVVNDPNWPI